MFLMVGSSFLFGMFHVSSLNVGILNLGIQRLMNFLLCIQVGYAPIWQSSSSILDFSVFSAKCAGSSPEMVISDGR